VGEGGFPPPCPWPCPGLPPQLARKILTMIKCSLQTIHMLRCCLLNVMFARQHRYLWFLRFQILKSRQICSFHCTSKSKKCFSFIGGGFEPWPPTKGSVPGSHYIFLMHTTSNLNKGRHLAHTHKNYCPVPCPCPQFQIPSTAHAMLVTQEEITTLLHLRYCYIKFFKTCI